MRSVHACLKDRHERGNNSKQRPAIQACPHPLSHLPKKPAAELLRSGHGGVPADHGENAEANCGEDGPEYAHPAHAARAQLVASDRRARQWQGAPWARRLRDWTALLLYLCAAATSAQRSIPKSIPLE